GPASDCRAAATPMLARLTGPKGATDSGGHRRQPPGAAGRLIEALGAEEADALMEYLPRTAWSDLATRHDLDRVASDIRAEMAGLRADIAEKMSAQTRTFMTSQIVLVVAVIGSITGAVATLAH